MRAHVIENGKVVNTIEVDSLDVFPDWMLVDASLGGNIGDSYADGVFTPPVVEVPVPSQVTMRQARLALLASGLLGNVDAAIASLPSPSKEQAQIEWEFSSTVERSRPITAMIGAALGLDETELDTLFIDAAKL